MSRPCRFFNGPGGCWKGESCPMIHDPDNNVDIPRMNRHLYDGSQGGARTFVPAGVCRSFYESDACDYGFTCTFKHISKNPISSASIAASIPDFKLFHPKHAHAPTSDNLLWPAKWLTPAEVHNVLRECKGRSFDTDSGLMYEFCDALLSVNRNNPFWTDEDRASCLTELTTTNPEPKLALRITEILEWHPIELCAGGRGEASFESIFMPLMVYMTLESVLNSPVNREVRALYRLIDNNINDVAHTLINVLNSLETTTIIKDPYIPQHLRMRSVFPLLKVVTLLIESYMARFKDAATQRPELGALKNALVKAFNKWFTESEKEELRYTDSITDLSPPVYEWFRGGLRQSLVKVYKIFERGTESSQPDATSAVTASLQKLSVASSTLHVYEGPGQSRHDNDFKSIRNIAIVPTQQELQAEKLYLPVNIPDGPHHLPPDSMERLLDVQFRLLREETIASLRESLEQVLRELSGVGNTKTLSALIKEGGGIYRNYSAFLPIFVDVTFESFSLTRNGFAIGLKVRAPAKAKSQKLDFWESKAGLSYGHLVALIRNGKVYLGTVTSTAEDVSRSSDSGFVQIDVAFLDEKLGTYVAQNLRQRSTSSMILVKSDIILDSVAPYLKALQNVEPLDVPFARYLQLQAKNRDIGVQSPAYTRLPGFRWNVKCLLPADKQESSRASFDPSDERQVKKTRALLATSDVVDESQGNAIMDILTQEVALVQGPPGTGKSYTGVKLIQTLLVNDVQPILLIAYTNHALDTLLSKIIEENVTTDIVRLGGQSQSEIVSKFNILEMEKISAHLDPSCERQIRRLNYERICLEKDMEDILDRVSPRRVPISKVITYLRKTSSAQSIVAYPPAYVSDLLVYLDQQEAEGWQPSRAKGGKSGKSAKPARSTLSLWVDGEDLEIFAAISRTNSFQRSSMPFAKHGTQPFSVEAGFANPSSFFSKYKRTIPVPKRGSRTLQDIRRDEDLWSLNREERKGLYASWQETSMEDAPESAQEISRLKKEHARLTEDIEDYRSQYRLKILKRCKIVGATTSGAAKAVSLLKHLGPQVLIVEEAGQTLEAHVLASLQSSIKHLVMIGDPLQLRATINTYRLSVDNPKSGSLYKFDVSLQERLAGTGFKMSVLNVQRRMRSEVSDLIRANLYPSLKDHELVLSLNHRPNVRGMAKNVFLFDHQGPEVNGKGEDVSHHNPYEVQWCVALVKHFLRQGRYSHPGGIVVLVAYRGQLVEVRKALSQIVTVQLEERDAQQLNADDFHEDRPQLSTVNGGHIVKSTADQVVKIATIDAFQGCEADVVILSTVRNRGSETVNGPGNAKKTLGFLKSPNRANVALSRAREGLYILGDAELMLQASDDHALWPRGRGQVGTKWPFRCATHPQDLWHIDNPLELQKRFPQGGCTRPCGKDMSCGHVCPSTCHIDDPDHQVTKCPEKCTRALDGCGHPCPRLCHDECRLCTIIIKRVALRCGHAAVNIPCWQAQKPETYKCLASAKKKFASCDHAASVPCSVGVESQACQTACGIALACCDRACTSACHDCKALNRTSKTPKDGWVTRREHAIHLCDLDLPCGHFCLERCVPGHQCGPCKKPHDKVIKRPMTVLGGKGAKTTASLGTWRYE